jgi:hypothetical protein
VGFGDFEEWKGTRIFRRRSVGHVRRCSSVFQVARPSDKLLACGSKLVKLFISIGQEIKLYLTTLGVSCGTE